MGMLGHNQLIKVGGNETYFRRYEFEKASLMCVRLRDVEMDFFVDQPYILVSSLWNKDYVLQAQHFQFSIPVWKQF